MDMVLDSRVEDCYIFPRPEDGLMFIPQQLLSTVVFVGLKKADNSMRFGGTAFWITRPIGFNIQGNFAYLVTAKHVITSIVGKGLEEIWLRVNLRDGTSKPVRTHRSDWVLSESSDIAAAKIAILPEWDHAGWPLALVESNGLISAERMGLGREIFLAGLFTKRRGNQRNVPIVRIGNIAALPSQSEQIKLRSGDLVTAYLAETRSIGGLSGSPAFINIHATLRQDRDKYPSFFLFGMNVGHYDEEDHPGNDDAVADDGIERLKINTGISIIVPAEDIHFMVQRFLSRDNAEIKQHIDEHGPVEDSAFEEPMQRTREGINIPVPSKSRFLSDLEKASRKKE
jgi:hypothetical protein